MAKSLLFFLGVCAFRICEGPADSWKGSDSTLERLRLSVRSV